MPVYTCPECSTKLKRAQPVEPGKKLRCPECEAVFAVKAVKAAKAAPPVEKKQPEPAAAPAAKPRNRFDDDDGPANYGLVTADDTTGSQKERDKAYGPLSKRFETSKRGPALILVVKPSNFLLLFGVLTCVMGITGSLVATWPMIFKQEEVSNAKKGLYDLDSGKTRFVELSDDAFREKIWWLIGCVGYFIWGAIVCAGASKMHMIEMYWLAFTASIMVIICPLLPLGILLILWAYATDEPDMAYLNMAIICFAVGVFISGWNISTLLNKKVKEGFADETVIN